MAQTPYQATPEASQTVQRRRNRESKQRPLLLHYPECPDQVHYRPSPVLPLRPWRTQSHPWLPVVCSDATKDRLETRLDQPHSPPHYIQKTGCKMSRIPSPHYQLTPTNH